MVFLGPTTAIANPALLVATMAISALCAWAIQGKPQTKRLMLAASLCVLVTGAVYARTNFYFGCDPLDWWIFLWMGCF